MEEKMYKAKIDIGGYKAGDKVPEEKAKLWAEMYIESPVELVGAEATIGPESKDDEEKIEESEETNNGDAMHDDYLNRNADVVQKAIADDSLDEKTLDSLLKIESANKERKPVIKAIKLKLKSLN